MTAPLFSSTRRFRLWSYTVGHRELLLRATKEIPDSSLETRVDVLFVNVIEINIPTTLPEIEIVEADEAMRSVRPELLGDDQKLFILRGLGYIGHVVGGAMASHEDMKEWGDPSYWHDPTRFVRPR